MLNPQRLNVAPAILKNPLFVGEWNLYFSERSGLLRDLNSQFLSHLYQLR